MPQYARQDPNALIAKLEFLDEYGLKVTGIGSEQVAKISDAELDVIAQFLADHDMSLHIYAGTDFFNPDLDIVKRKVDGIVQQLGISVQETLPTHSSSCKRQKIRVGNLLNWMLRTAMMRFLIFR